MARLLYAFPLVITLLLSVKGQAPATAPVLGCDVTKVCGGPLKVAASIVIGPKEINGKLIDFFACECLNGTRTAVSKDGTIIIPLDAAPVAAPAPAPVPAPAAVPASAPSTTPAFDAATYAADLKSTYPTLCSRVNATLLSNSYTNPTGCRRAVKLGEVCWSSCRATLRGIGQSCYAVAVAKGNADPTLVGSNTTVAYSQCSKGLPYTTIAEWDPNATAAPLPGASPTPEGESTSPATESPAADGGAAAPAGSAGWRPSVFAVVPLVVVSFII